MNTETNVYITVAVVAVVAWWIYEIIIYPRQMARMMRELDANRAANRAARIRQTGSTFQEKILRRVA